MKLPTLLDYQQAVQVPRLAFLDDRLRESVPRLTPLGMPAVVTGGFALTFEVAVDGRRYAVRCFHRHSDNLELRYACIAEFVRSAALDFLVGVDYLPTGIRVRDHPWPIVRMEWIEGARLDDWIQENLPFPVALDRARLNLSSAVRELRRRGVAHGDLQHGNILVTPDRAVRLIDYDGMYLPALGALGASERGHRNYQHPDRINQYDATLDRFAEEVIGVSLAALAREPGLWKEFNTGENLIFSASDFADPGASPLFSRLERIPGVAAVSRRLRDACLVGYDDACAVLDAAPAPPPRRAAPVGVVATVSAARYIRARPVSRSPGVLSAADRAGLLARQGEEVTVVGRISRVRQIQRTGTITVLDFGDDRDGDFSVVGWDRVSRELGATHGDPAGLEGQWVRVIGLLTIDDRARPPGWTSRPPGWTSRSPAWTSRSPAAHSTRPPRAPRIELRRASLLRVLTEREAHSLLHRPLVTTPASTTRSVFGSGPVLPPPPPRLPPRPLHRPSVRLSPRPAGRPASLDRSTLWPGWS